MYLRRTLPPLEDSLPVTREILCPDVSRSGLGRCLHRQGVDNLNALEPTTPQEPHKVFESYKPGFVAIKPNKTPTSAHAFLNALYKACPI